MAYPRMAPDTARGDAWPPNGGPPGSDLDFMRKQHLDANNIEYGVLHPLRIGGYDERNMDFSQALCTAINDWQIDAWVGPEPRLRGSIYVPQDYPEAAVKEIERRAGDPRFVQVSCAPQSEAPLGNRRYWPMFEATCAANRPLALHIGGIPRPSADRHGLAVLLFRAPLLQRAVGAVGGDQHGARRRVRAVPEAARAAGRRPALPGRRRCAGGWISTGSACGTRCRM